MDGVRTNGAASLKISATTALPKHMQDGIREITHVMTEPESRKQGLMTNLFYQVCYEADKEKKVLILTPESTGDMTDKQLIKFYRGFGFEIIQNQPILMARPHG